MCGIFGVVAVLGRAPSLSDEQALRCRDELAHRGPDGAGLVRDRNMLFAHRRLAIIDTSDAGAQPMRADDGRFSLVYNGELYNDAELRRALLARGVRFTSSSDAETVLHALAQWGPDALRRLRGMYALAFFDARENSLLLARDPLGVKPLYFSTLAHEVAFASESGALLRHPAIVARPNLSMVSAYLTTIRTVLGNDTLFDAIHAVAPGQAAHFSLAGNAPRVRLTEHWDSPPVDRSIGSAPLDAAARVHDALADSLSRHLRADVPVGSLLSGGLDSTILTALASREISDLRTYCSGADTGEDDADPAAARRIAEALGVRHAEALVTRESFSRDWADMVDRMGVPLSTPNEVAIHAVARRMRADGRIVAISGEGADELFAGYEAPLLASLADIEASRRRVPGAGLSPGAFELASAAWIGARDKPAILRPEVWESVDHDAPLGAFYDAEFDRCAASCAPAGVPGADCLEARLRLHRRINLTGLLQRLDSATMLTGVEGRTPFADSAVAALADSIPMSLKLEARELSRDDPSHSDAPCHGPAPQVRADRATTQASPTTKRILRRAFADLIPAEALERPKASFPLPFQSWVADSAGALRDSSFARAIFSPDAIDTVCADPSANWRAAWPMINIARWGDRWWGR